MPEKRAALCECLFPSLCAERATGKIEHGVTLHQCCIHVMCTVYVSFFVWRSKHKIIQLAVITFSPSLLSFAWTYKFKSPVILSITVSLSHRLLFILTHYSIHVVVVAPHFQCMHFLSSAVLLIQTYRIWRFTQSSENEKRVFKWHPSSLKIDNS